MRSPSSISRGIAEYRRPRIDYPPYAVAQCPGAIGKERG
jgi:hypothetical protein